MNLINFNKLVDRRCDLIKKILKEKGEEYCVDENDRFHNFNRSAEALRCQPEEALVHEQYKHIVSILDLIDIIATAEEDEVLVCTHEYVDEKIGDAINYFILLEGMLKERINKANEELEMG